VPGEDGAGGVTFRPGVMSQAPDTAEALEGILPPSRFGYDRGITQVLGGVTRTQWLTTLTGESPTSSVSTLVAGAVTRVDKAYRNDSWTRRSMAVLPDGGALGTAALPE
jgi:hypothetical protein